MAVTPNYSWPVPDDTDLVKDGAEAIRDLGNAIDTTVDNLPSGGLVHIETQTLSAVASVSFNNVFSADYENYKILVRGATATNGELRWRMRASGSDNTTSNFQNQLVGSQSTAAFAARGTNETSGYFGFLSTRYNSGSMELSSPFLSQFTTANILTNYLNTGDTDPYVAIGASIHRVASSFDGITIFHNANITGSISVYGYAKA